MSQLASQRHCIERITANWEAFQRKRRERLVQQVRHGSAAEKVAENILEDLFTTVLDWPLSDLNNQLGYADLVLTSLGIKRLVVEVKRPDLLVWHRSAVSKALDQAWRYAEEQRVTRIAVSDGTLFYAANLTGAGLQDRIHVRLDTEQPPEALWWVSVHGIYREHAQAAIGLDAPPSSSGPADGGPDEELCDRKYQLPARCFGYVPKASDPRTWKLPHRHADGSIDTARLPKAIQAILSNYRGARTTIPEADVPDVLVTLARAAKTLGKMPGQGDQPAPVYLQLHHALEQLGRLEDV